VTGRLSDGVDRQNGDHPRGASQNGASQTGASAMPTPTPRRLLGTLGVSMLAAAAILVLFVLPAEYQIDPSGVGRALGIDRLGGGLETESIRAAPPGQAVPQEQPPRSEQVLLELRPHEEMELKIAMREGDTVLFAWQSEGGAIYSDFHAEPFGEPPGGAIRYQEGEAVTSGYGALNAPFAGHHGWYWVNPNETPVQVELEITGYYAALKERRR
jgi:hypothetical protein